MSTLFLIGGITWTLLLGLWAYRLSAYDMYAEKPWVWLWIAGRLFLRFGLGMALLWALVATTRPLSPAYRILIVDAHHPKAWEQADTLLRQRYKGIETGLIALKGSQAIWVLPPTHDPALFRWIKEVRPREVSVPPNAERTASARYLTTLSSYLPFVSQIVWIGCRLPSNPPETLHLLWCEKNPPPSYSGPVFYSVGALPSPERPLSETHTALFLAAGSVLLLLLGDGLMTYILRQNLPLK